MLAIPNIGYGGQMARPMADGDLLPTNHQVNTLTTVGAGTLTAGLIAGGIVRRTGPVGGYADTTDTAENIRLALKGSSGGSPPDGISFLFMFINGVAQAQTVTAGQGVTLTGTVNVAASTIRLYNVTLVNGTPQQAYSVSQTNASGVITGMTLAQTQTLSVGMAAFGTSIAASSFISSIQPGVGVTLSQNATATLAGNLVTFTPVVNFEGLMAGTA